MTTYSWHNPTQTILQATEEDGRVYLFNPEVGNPFYAEFLASGEEAAPYVAPPELAPLTTEEKVDQLLSDYGLTRDEMRTALEADTATA